MASLSSRCAYSRAGVHASFCYSGDISDEAVKAWQARHGTRYPLLESGGVSAERCLIQISVRATPLELARSTLSY